MSAASSPQWAQVTGNELTRSACQLVHGARQISFFISIPRVTSSRRRAFPVQVRAATMLVFRLGATMRRRDVVTRIGATIILALCVSLLAVPTSLKAQKAAGINRVGWLEVCNPDPRPPLS